MIDGLSHGHVDGFLQAYAHDRRAVLVGIAEPDASVAASYVRRYHLDPGLIGPDLDALLARTHPQAVLVYTTTFGHRAAVETCARRGIPVIMEKPLAVSLADALAIRDAAVRGKIAVIVNYETTWYSSNRAAFDLVQANALGAIRKVVIHDGHQGPIEIGVTAPFLTWLTDPQLDGAGALFDFGCYGADLITWLTDNRRPETVTAVTQQIKPKLYPRVDDEATIVLTYPGAQAIIQASWNWPFGRKDMEVYGATGSAITVGSDHIRVRRSADAAEQTIAARPLPAPYADELSYLRAVVLDGLAPQGPGALDTNIIAMEILDAARRSAASGRTIRLSQ